MDEKINVAILGYGLSGSVFHYPLLKSNNHYHVSKIYTSKTNIDEVMTTDNLDEILHDDSIELVINTLPNEFHYDLSLKCLKARKNVVIEKPFVNTIQEGLDLIKYSESQGLKISVFHNRRWDYDYVALKSSLKDLGNIHLYESRFDRYSPTISKKWREKKIDGSGVLFDLGPHLVDQVIQLFGLPKKIFADIRCLRKKSVIDDDFQIILFYQDKKVILKSSTLIKHTTPRFEVFGDKGSFKSVEIDPQESLLKNGLTPIDKNWDEAIRNQKYTLNGKSKILNNGGYENYYHQLFQFLRKDYPNPVDPKDALRTIDIILKCFESSRKMKVIDYIPEVF